MVRGRGGTSAAVVRRVRHARADVFLVAAALLILGPIVAPWHAQSASRMALTDSLAEHGTVEVRREPLGVDYSVRPGNRQRSDKAPGQPVLAVPFYLAARAAGAESTAHYRPHDNLTQWWETLWSATVPFAVLLVLLRRHAARVAPKLALPVTIAFGAATLLMPLGVNLFGHMLAATLLFGAWTLLDRATLSRASLLGAGFLAGVSVFVEYEAVIVVAVLAAYVVWKRRGDAWWYVLAGAPGAAALAYYHWRAFGAPWQLPYGSYVGKSIGTGHMGARFPLAPMAELLLSPFRGLVIASPLVLVALAAAVIVARDRTNPARHHAIVALAIFGGVLLFVATFDGSDLAEIPGPRFLLVALPFLVTPLAVAWQRVAAVAKPAIVAGVIMNGMATWTFFFVGHDLRLWNAYPHRLADGDFNPTVWSIALGRVGVGGYVASIAVVVLVGYRLNGAPRPLRPVRRIEQPALAR